jgi:MFS transporter, ACS family, glucarate transporter
MQDALHISPVGWGWITGIFTVSYALFEIPSGILADRIGSRRVLTRVVLWWSAFTSITGMVTGFYPLLFTRFLFGAGEAGAFPGASVVISRWFPVHERGRAFGVILMAGQLGGAFAPLLIVPIQMRYGWRVSFLVFGLPGVIWSAVWYGWFRDSPSEKPGLSQTERDEVPAVETHSHQKLPWSSAARSANFRCVMVLAFCYVYTYYFFQSWFHTYLVKARAYSETDLLLSSLPFIVAATTNLGGGLLTNILIRKIGLRWGRCSIGVASLAISALCMAAMPFTTGVGAMNTTAQIGSFVSTVVYGYIVNRFGNYELPFIPMALFLLCGSALWLKIDPANHLTTPPVLERQASA